MIRPSNKMIDHLPIYGDGKQVRDWLHVKDDCSQSILFFHKGKLVKFTMSGKQREGKY